jgi:Tripartite tricarboxylate transporter TctB family
METQMQRPRDVVGGCLIVAVGALFLLLGRDLEFGNSFQMGPGYFPTVLSILTMILGAVMAFTGLRGARVEGAFSHIPWIGVISVIGSVVFFGFTIRGIGIAPAVALVVLATASASRYSRLTTSVLLALGMGTFCTFLFVYALGLPLPIFGPWLSLEHWSPTVTAPAQ